MSAILGRVERSEEGSRMRLRRTNSTSRAEDIVTEDAKVRRSQPDKPIHSPRDSLLSWSSEFTNYEGLVNWAFLLLAMGGIRLFLENINKYGVRVDLISWVFVLIGELVQEPRLSDYPALYLILYTNVPILLILLLEKLIARDVIPWRLGCFLHMANLLLMLFIPIVVINVKSNLIGPLGATVVTVTYSILFLKMWSYVQVNHWCRCSSTILGVKKQARHQSIFRKDSVYKDKSLFKASTPSSLLKERPKDETSMSQSITSRTRLISQSQEKKIVMWPDNLSVRDIYYFWLAPTLCYELNFPRTSRVRTMFLLRRLLEVVVGANVAAAVVQQYIVPSVANSLEAFANMEAGNASERLLKLAIPNHMLWLILFYLIFHSGLNTSGEILQFADRDFYHDWWNAPDIGKFWTLWNLPVHRWCVRHLYKPFLKNGNSKTVATLAVFFTSAFFHEYLVSVPLRLFKVWGFIGMMAQIPLFPLTKWISKNIGPRLGNVVVWLSLILGQPLGVMMYYHDYVVEHLAPQDVQAFVDSSANITSHM